MSLMLLIRGLLKRLAQFCKSGNCSADVLKLRIAAVNAGANPDGASLFGRRGFIGFCGAVIAGSESVARVSGYKSADCGVDMTALFGIELAQRGYDRHGIARPCGGDRRTWRHSAAGSY